MRVRSIFARSALSALMLPLIGCPSSEPLVSSGSSLDRESGTTAACASSALDGRIIDRALGQCIVQARTAALGLSSGSSTDLFRTMGDTLELAAPSKGDNTASADGALPEAGNPDPSVPEYEFGPDTLHTVRYNATEESIESYMDNYNYRIEELEIRSVEPLRFDVILVKNQGDYLLESQFHSGVTPNELASDPPIVDGSLRIAQLKPYVKDGSLLFAVVLVDNTGNNAKSWNWYYDAGIQSLSQTVYDNGNRLIDVEAYEWNGSTRYSGVSIANTGDDFRDTGVLIGASLEFLKSYAESWPGYQYIDFERMGSDQYLAVMSARTPSEPQIEYQRHYWFYDALSIGDIAHLSKRHWARPIDLEYAGSGRFDAIFVDNGYLSTGEPKAGFAGFDAIMVDTLKRNGIPGATLAIAHHGDLIYARGYGLADVGTSKLATPETLFRIGSISKTFTAMAAMKLIQSGAKTPGGDPITLSTRAFRDVIAPALGEDHPHLDAVTIEHLLHHEGGWYEQGSVYPGDTELVQKWPLPLNDTINAAAGLGIQTTPRCTRMVEYFLPTPLDVAPGTKYYYSGVGICAVASVIEAASGKGFEQYFLDNFATPLGLNQGKVRFWESSDYYAGKKPNEARFYMPFRDPKVTPAVVELADGFDENGKAVFDEGNLVEKPYGGVPMYSTVPVGGWASTSVAMLRLATALQHTRHPWVLANGTFEEFRDNTSVEMINGGSFGLGWGRSGDGIDHSGATWGGWGYYNVGGNDGISWVILFNAWNPDWSAKSRVATEINARKSLIKNATWDLFSGYGFPESDPLNVQMGGGGDSLQMNPQPILQLEPTTDFTR